MDGGIRQIAPFAQGDEADPGEDRQGVPRRRARGSRVILDTNALSAFADGDAGVGDILRRQSRVVLPVIVLGEFRYGIASSRHRAAYQTWLDALLATVEVLPVTEETARSYAALRI